MRGHTVLAGAVLGLVLLVGPAEVRADLMTGLIGYWPFDGSGTDSSGGGRDLTLTSGTGYGTGLFGQALSLDGNAAHYATRPTDDNIYDFGSNDFTVQAWVKYNSTWGEQILIEKFFGGGGPGWTLTKLWGNEWHFWASPSAVLYSPAQAIPTGVWHQVLMRSSGDSFELFFDGSLIASGSDSDPVPDTGKPLLVGRRDLGGYATDGLIDEVAIWNRALDNSEISYLYNRGSGNSVASSAIPEPSTLALFGVGLPVLAAMRRRRKK